MNRCAGGHGLIHTGPELRLLYTARLFCWLFSLWRQCSNIQYSQDSKYHKYSNLPRRETPRSPSETPWCCSSTRCRSWDLERSEENGKSGCKVWTLWEWRTGSGILHESPQANWLTTTTYTSRVKQHRGSGQQEEEVTFSDGHRTNEHNGTNGTWTTHTHRQYAHTPLSPDLAGEIKTDPSFRSGILRGKRE